MSKTRKITNRNSGKVKNCGDILENPKTNVMSGDTRISQIKTSSIADESMVILGNAYMSEIKMPLHAPSFISVDLSPYQFMVPSQPIGQIGKRDTKVMDMDEWDDCPESTKDYLMSTYVLREQKIILCFRTNNPAAHFCDYLIEILANFKKSDAHFFELQSNALYCAAKICNVIAGELKSKYKAENPKPDSSRNMILFGYKVNETIDGIFLFSKDGDWRHMLATGFLPWIEEIDPGFYEFFEDQGKRMREKSQIIDVMVKMISIGGKQ